ncbi:MAG: cytochrome c oxidase accessory protein CcoG [Epsilonproteobacteria bacterium]|nr:cytochrome c oxidase accessory protein CcoG [Campylobacterota bacterium]
MAEKKLKKHLYRYKRYYVFIAITIVALVLPWIRINGNHFFLLNFDHMKVHLFFVKFDMQELYLMPFLLIMGFLGVFFMTTLGGRVWCGWACPQTIFRVIYRDLLKTKLLGIRKSIQNKQAPDKKGTTGKQIIAFVIWAILAFIAGANFIWYFVPPEDFLKYIQHPSEHMVMIGFIVGIAAFLIYDITKLKEDFCIYVCPYARVQSVMYDEETIQAVYDVGRGGQIYEVDPRTGVSIGKKKAHNRKELLAQDPDAECTYCEACVRVCPTHIDIREGTQLECINCLECADACTKVMGSLGKPSLIEWNSISAVKEHRRPKFLRFRTIAYGVALTVAFIALLWMSTTKEYMLLNVNRTTELYETEDHGKIVENAYIMLFQNTDNKDHKYYFTVLKEDKTPFKAIYVKKPNKPFPLSAGKKVKKIAVLATKEILAKDYKKDVTIPIIIKAYAVDDPKKIVVYRKTIFAFPRYDNLMKLRKEQSQ